MEITLSSGKMILTRFVIGKSYKIVTQNLKRNIQTTQVLLFQLTDSKSRRLGTRSQSPWHQQRLVKDSELVDTNDENGEGEIHPGPNFLEQAYHEQMRELKDENRRISKIIMKKSFAKKPKEPNMLTYNERQHMMFLHNSDPHEWSAEHLSESFPALPSAIKKILKKKWIPVNEQKMKTMDEAVLQNWEKLKENKLQASQELLEHLKKFIDKRENLKIQLQNPKFFHLPEVKKKLIWKSGNLNKLLLKYEKEIEKLKENSKTADLKLLPESMNGNENESFLVNPPTDNRMTLVANDNKNINSEESLFKERDVEVDTRFPKRKREKAVTLQKLKEDIFHMSENPKYSMSRLEEEIIQKTLIKHDRNKSEISKSNSNQEKNLYLEDESKCRKTTPTLLDTKKDNRKEMKRDEILEKDNLSFSQEQIRKRGRRRRNEFSTEKESVEETDESIYYPNTFKITDLGSKLFGAHDEKENEAEFDNTDEKTNVDESSVKLTGKKTVKPVNFFNTEKDNQIFEQHEKLLSETVFWKAEKRTRSLDAGFGTCSTEAGPHVASHIQTYFTYDYPLKIKIPEDKREKGKLYRVKDCYYDDSGIFLYRVPGMTE